MESVMDLIQAVREGLDQERKIREAADEQLDHALDEEIHSTDRTAWDLDDLLDRIEDLENRTSARGGATCKSS